MSDQIRMTRLLEDGKACNASVALARARQLYGVRKYCPAPVPVAIVPLESEKMAAVLASACTPIVRSGPGTEGTRIARLQDCYKYESESADPQVRFKKYVRFFATPCPPVGADYLNASMPKPSTGCQLPNGPFNPILPA